jgi:hypothetical protein
LLIGIGAVVFGLVMLAVIKLFELRKAKPPSGLFWIMVAGILAISLMVGMTSGCPVQPFL